MIIYKIQENGRATDFQHAKKCPDEWKSIEGNKIPDNISVFHEQKYLDAEKVAEQKKECQRILTETDHKMLPGYQYPEDFEAWGLYRKEICDIMKSETIREFPKKPF